MRIPQKATTGTCASAAAEGLIIQNTGGTQVGHICIDGPTSGSANKLRYYAEQFSATSTDVAENYSDISNNLAPGDLVALDPNGPVKAITKATAANSSQLLGIVSTSPGILLSDIAEDGSSTITNPKPVALTGRIPTNVSAENGPIAVGDYLTISSTPGVAMKATGPGPVIGKALENYSGSGVGQVLVLAQASYYAGPSTASYIQNGGNAMLSNLTVGGTADLANLNTSGTATINNLTVTGAATITNLTVTGSATIASLHVTSSAVFDSDITIGGHVITAGGQPTIQVQTATGTGASVSVDGKDTTGTITITTGSNPTAGDLAKILFNRTYGQTPHIILSPSNNNAAGLRFYKGATSVTAFMFNALDNPAPNTTYTFDYFISQ